MLDPGLGLVTEGLTELPVECPAPWEVVPGPGVRSLVSSPVIYCVVPAVLPELKVLIGSSPRPLSYGTDDHVRTGGDPLQHLCWRPLLLDRRPSLRAQPGTDPSRGLSMDGVGAATSAPTGLHRPQSWIPITAP